MKKGTYRDEDPALRILGHICEVQEAGKTAAEVVVAHVEDMHQDLSVRKLQRLELQHRPHHEELQAGFMGMPRSARLP